MFDERNESSLEVNKFCFENNYCTHVIITLSWFETTLDYKPWILDPEIEEFPCLVHKLSVTLTTLQYKWQWKMG